MRNKIIVLLIVIGYLLFGLFLFKLPAYMVEKLAVTFKETGQVGDTIGGVTAPFIGYAGAFITFLAFWIQFSANRAQTEQFAQQDLSARRDRFEAKFFEFLRIHRENVSALRVGSLTGQACFQGLFDELRFAYHIVHRSLNANRDLWPQGITYDHRHNLDIAFSIVFWGLPTESIDTSTDILLPRYPRELLGKILGELRARKGVNAYVPQSENLQAIRFTLPQPPFDGHSEALGLYFRHLYSWVKFIDAYDKKVLSLDQKYEYAKIVRAQLAGNEQMLLYYDSLTVLGKAWLTESLITRYKLIKNIPLPLAYFGTLPRETFPNASADFFEWDEIRKTELL